MTIPGIMRVFHLDQNGNFIGKNENENFRSKFSEIFKNLQDVLDVFTQLPGTDYRERGVYEVEHNRLYYVSTGNECYFIAADPASVESSIIKLIKDAISCGDDFFF